MRKYVIYNVKGKISILEVECEILSALEDQSIMWLPVGEFKVKITAPDCLLEKRVIGKDTVLDPIHYYSHSIYDSETLAAESAIKSMIESLKRDASKRGLVCSEKDILDAVSDIKTIKL